MRILCLLVLLVGIPIPFASAQITSDKNDFEKALEAYESEDYEQAFFLIDQWIKDHPTDATAYWYQGQIYEKFPGENEPFALEYYNQAIFHNPEIASFFFSRGRLLLKMERFGEAAEDFKTFLRLPKGETTQIIYRKNATEGGVSGIFTEQSENLTPVFYHLGLCYMGMKQYEEALNYFNQAIKGKAEADYFAEKGFALWKLNKNEEAEKALIHALEISPEHFIAKERLALIQGKDITELQEPYDLAIKNKPEDPQVWKKRGYFFLNQGKLDEAKQDLEKAVELNPQDPESWLYLGTVFNREELHKQAENYFSEGLFQDERNPELLLARGQARYQLGNLEGAMADFIQLIAVDPALPTAYYHRGITLLRMDRKSEACQNLKLAADWGMEASQQAWEKACQN
ncbi:tetratricopeptide repeat protein [Algoriphagus limi]|uniref:Tetratricopeptide repeat protein n=1 Tax=Algoriphagus limi TaxID=2975273 RepID=A0ABT2G7N6_9BACT|nr:tetratricopeptide repeat protein [Algoriphagus limi]MCS5491142.1 tetratricopeptide repeat protein [Algoriphagus limi]